MCRIAAQYDTAQSPFVAESSGELERAASNDLDTVLWELDIMLETTISVAVDAVKSSRELNRMTPWPKTLPMTISKL